MPIHPSALVDPAADVDPRAHVGPYCLVAARARLEPGVVLRGHVVVGEDTRIGGGTQVGPFAVLGGRPQKLGYEGPSYTHIGRDCVIREHATVHGGTEPGDPTTHVGDGCQLFGGAHVAHDCQVGAGSILINHVLLGGHVRVGAGVTLGGGAAVHQFVRIGDGAFVGGGAIVLRDVVPYGLARGDPAELLGLNLVGLRRSGLPRPVIRRGQAALAALFDAERGSLEERAEALLGSGAEDIAGAIARFVREPSRRRFLALASA